jgi:hypothetical protein
MCVMVRDKVYLEKPREGGDRDAKKIEKTRYSIMRLFSPSQKSIDDSLTKLEKYKSKTCELSGKILKEIPDSLCMLQ